MKHDFIKTGDPDIFPQILDRNGEVALRYCRRCRKGEGELGPECRVRSEIGCDCGNCWICSGGSL